MKKTLLVLFALAAFGCAGGSVKKDASGKTLYQRLGELKAITAVIDLTLERAGKDARLKDYFVGADMPLLRKHLIQITCLVTGGPCHYEGRGMKESHENLFITNAAFDALLEDIHFTLRKLKVGSDEQAELLQILNGTRKDIVELKN